MARDGGLVVQFVPFSFRPPGWATLAAAAGVALTLALGNWQLDRASQKEALQLRLERLSREPPVRLSGAPAHPEDLKLRRVEVRGEFAARETFYVDNRVYRGRAGYYVVTPLRIAGSDTYVLVNRGWVAGTGRRETLPEVKTPAGTVTVTGIAMPGRERVMALSNDPAEGRVWQRIDVERFRQRFPHPLLPIVVQQGGAADDGLVRDWPPFDLGIERHKAYALQWFAFAATILVLYIVLNAKRKP
ncbi:MAG: SURF1-like protein [Burkholderiales bacterium]|nr:MAG: SURF1-like protein [Burkholderiales bacterium]